MRAKFPYILALATLLIAANASAMPPFAKSKGKKAPIEVTSDSLEVLQQENRAVFSGHVVAIQGDVRLKADRMNVFYAKQDEKAASKKKRPGKDDTAAGSIRKIEATGSVFLSTAEETASGNSGIYDVAHDQIHLNDNVVLTRGQNVLKGNKLTYNFATGKSVLTGGASAQTPGQPSNGRVRALFVPEDNKGKK